MYSKSNVDNKKKNIRCPIYLRFAWNSALIYFALSLNLCTNQAKLSIFDEI